MFVFVKVLRLENSVFLPFLFVFYLLSPFPSSAYLCTPLGRQPTISAQTSAGLASLGVLCFGCLFRADAPPIFGKTVNKKRERCLVYASSFSLFVFVKVLRLENSVFLPFLLVFYLLFPFSRFGVPLYASHPEERKIFLKPRRGLPPRAALLWCLFRADAPSRIW